MKITYPTAFSSWGTDEFKAMYRVHDSGRYTMGPEVEAFEREFAAYYARKHGIMVNSGSSANLVAVAALHEKIQKPLRRPEIAWLEKSNGLSEPCVRHPETAVVPAIAWSTTYAPLVQHGMNLHVADVDETWNAPVPSWLPYTTRLVVACSILGNPAYLAAWAKAADKLGAYMIEDNCESLGAVDGEGLRCGAAGIMSTFSFFYSHQISAIEGGMILTDDDELNNTCRILRAHGWTRDIEFVPPAFPQEYNFTMMGYNVRPLEMHAAVAREQLKKLPQFIAARLANWRHFAKISTLVEIDIPRVNGTLSPFGLPFTLNEEEKRETLALALRAEGIDCRLPTGGSFRMHPYGAPWARQKTPNADRIHRAGMFLGNAPWDIREDIERAVAVMRRVLG